ncbi:Glu-tRNA(Gln) amidotransferase subunit GatD [Candidatus Woesearchaeota archaeon]|nr:Glu-tRNA(Gln) amidotransferase subunit GatD [Candidatus Woesearchaeota archaeon]
MKAGDRIKVVTKEETVEGILVPSPELEKDVLIIKLDSGYNIGIEKKKVKEMKLVSAAKERRDVFAHVKKDKKLPTIAILHTGGTIASKADYRTGGVIAKFTPKEILEMFPEIREIANIDSRLIRNMWSEDMRFPHYNLMAKEVEREVKKGVDGVIITHGTDTMHYTSAALSFILEDLPVPVILVGAQRSSDRGSSDAGENLIDAAYFIANSDFAEVAICMHENIEDKDCLILPGTKTRKMHTSRRDAFRPINATAIARVNHAEKKICFIRKKYAKKSKGKVNLKLIDEKLKVGSIKTHPNMYAEEFSEYEKFDGLVIEGYALGQAPVNKDDDLTNENERILEKIKLFCRKMPVVMASQAIYGRLQMNVYSTARDLREIGVLGHLSDMTPETTFIKLAWLLSNYKKEEVKDLITKNLRGEISERTEKETFLV